MHIGTALLNSTIDIICVTKQFETLKVVTTVHAGRGGGLIQLDNSALQGFFVMVRDR